MRCDRQVHNFYEVIQVSVREKSCQTFLVREKFI